MSDKERLQEIKESWVSEGHLAKIDREHFDWLIEQVEKAEELVQSLNDAAEMAEQFLNDKHFYMDELKKTEQQLQQAQAKIERYEKALKGIKNDIETDYTQEEIALGEMTSLLTVIYEQVQQTLEGSEEMNSETLVKKLNDLFWDRKLTDYDVANQMLSLMDDNAEVVQFDSALKEAHRMLSIWSRSEKETGQYLDNIADLLDFKEEGMEYFNKHKKPSVGVNIELEAAE
ncbi:hypothetical protein NST12_16660 [Bacillus sp. FSL W8-1127]|uniref:hypothetical protein n=1 Tax=Bacillus sp. FSL W8-1127 TaxID=2954710 RepID=UPI0030FCD744